MAGRTADHDRLLKTYRYLRIGMIGVVLALAVSILIERSAVDCWQSSVSSYYYTPVRAILVGSVMAIGVSLIVIKGDGRWEDIFFNFAGIMAPAVAVIPTASVGTCWSVEPQTQPRNAAGEWAEWAQANIDNNTKALLIAGFAGLVTGAVLAMVSEKSILGPVRAGVPEMRIGLLVTFGLLVLITAGYLWWDDFSSRAHGLSAVAMFVFLGLGIASNAHQRRERPGRRWFMLAYAAIVAAMAISGLVIGFFPGDWDHRILILETVEIALFAAFWAVQTYEHWNDTGLPPVEVDTARTPAGV